MNRMETMSAAARQAMKHVLDLVPEDRVLVVTDKATENCGAAFAAGARDHGCEVVTYDLPEHNRPLQQMPLEMNALLDDVTVVINAIMGDCREIPFRLQWIHAIEMRGYIRMGHSPGINEDMMVSGPMNVDYGKMLATAGDLMAGFSGATGVHITTPAGTDLRLDLSGRPFTHDLKATVEVGANLPCGEIYCAPVESGAEGLLVVDGCFACHGMVPSPLSITVEGGRAVDVACNNREVVEIVNGFMDTDAGSRVIAELGIGLNPGARLTERMLEAEKAHHTAHIAFGSNEGFPGGINHSTTHIDYLVLRPTMEVTRATGGSKLIMEDGEPV
jgi:leucyl aminopeptidase (aminopeptidase T)